MKRRLRRVACLALLAAALVPVAGRWLYLPLAIQRLAQQEALDARQELDRLSKEWPEDVAASGMGAAESDRWRELRRAIADGGTPPEDVAAIARVIQARYPAERTVAAPVHAQSATILWRPYWAVTVCWGHRAEIERRTARPANVSVLVIEGQAPYRFREEQELLQARPSARLTAPFRHAAKPGAPASAGPTGRQV